MFVLLMFVTETLMILLVAYCFLSWLRSVVLLIVFFFKQKTAYEMRISDWSSDVCSSDLFDVGQRLFDRAQTEAAAFLGHAEPQNSELGHFRPERGIGIADLPELVRAQPFERGAGRQKAADHIDNLLLFFGRDRKSTRLTPVTNAHLVCRLLLEKKKHTHKQRH